MQKRIFMLFMALTVGIVAGFCALLFRALVAFMHNLFFLGEISLIYHETFHTPASMWGPEIILVPVLGGAVVVFLIKNFANNQTGLSVPGVMYNVHNENARFNPFVSLVKALASAISLGTGASIGREGPVIQIGAAASALIGDTASNTQRKVLVAAGTAAATAAIFNAPYAGVAFAIELVLIRITAFNLLLITIATLTASYIGHFFLGQAPIFFITAIYGMKGILTILLHSGLFLFFGILIGCISVIFIRSVYWTQDLFDSFFKNDYLRHMIGMFFVGLMFYLLLREFGHYYIQGIGFATIHDWLHLLIKNPWLLLILFFCKWLATCLTLGSGASGGIFSPALFLGAALGSILALVYQYFFPDIPIDPVLFVLAGMAGMVASTTGAILTGIILIMEISKNLDPLLFIIITAFTAYIVRKRLCDQSVYTMKLVRQGKYIQWGRE